MSQTEPAWRKPLFIGCTHGIRIGGTGGECICGEGHYQRMEYIRREGHQRWQIRICCWKADVETEDGRSIGTWGTCLRQPSFNSHRKAAEKLSPAPKDLPLRTKSTPDQREGSPGVRLTYTPGGGACFKLALRRCGQRLALRRPPSEKQQDYSQL